jgi:hypothetical protein
MAVCSGNCDNVKVSLILHCNWLIVRSFYGLGVRDWGHECHLVFHVWHSPTLSTVQQHPFAPVHTHCYTVQQHPLAPVHTHCHTVQQHPVAPVHTHCLLLHSNSVNTKCSIYVATTAQWIQQKVKCVLFRAFLSYKILDELDVDVLWGWYKDHRVWNGLSCFGQVHFLVFLTHYKLLRYISAGNVMVVFSKKTSNWMYLVTAVSRLDYKHFALWHLLSATVHFTCIFCVERTSILQYDSAG